jgi:ribonuclease E
LLRQANDAEVAVVRKVGDEDYEIVAQGTPGRAALPSESQPPAEAPSVAPAEPEAAGSTPAPAGRENGQRLGLRFRRGSRAPIRSGEIPLIGVVQADPAPPEIAQTASAAPSSPEEPAPKRPRPRRPRKAAATAPATGESAGPPEGNPAAEAPAPRRPRTRARKKTAE